MRYCILHAMHYSVRQCQYWYHGSVQRLDSSPKIHSPTALCGWPNSSGSATPQYCNLKGDLLTLAQRCLTDPLCYAFTWLPAQEAAWLEGGVGMTQAMMATAVNSAAANPSAVLYYVSSQAAKSGSPSG
jgi:hypothetical protein